MGLKFNLWHIVLTLGFYIRVDLSLSILLLLRWSADSYLSECVGECFTDQCGRHARVCTFVSFALSQVWPSLTQLEWHLTPKSSSDLPVLAVYLMRHGRGRTGQTDVRFVAHSRENAKKSGDCDTKSSIFPIAVLFNSCSPNRMSKLNFHLVYLICDIFRMHLHLN